MLVAALRSGIVVVPANTAYRERELAHIVTDARPTAALVDVMPHMLIDAEAGDAVEPDLEVRDPVAVHVALYLQLHVEVQGSARCQ